MGRGEKKIAGGRRGRREWNTLREILLTQPQMQGKKTIKSPLNSISKSHNLEKRGYSERTGKERSGQGLEVVKVERELCINNFMVILLRTARGEVEKSTSLDLDQHTIYPLPQFARGGNGRKEGVQ